MIIYIYNAIALLFIIAHTQNCRHVFYYEIMQRNQFVYYW